MRSVYFIRCHPFLILFLYILLMVKVPEFNFIIEIYSKDTDGFFGTFKFLAEDNIDSKLRQ